MFDSRLRSTKELLLSPIARYLYSVHPIVITFIALAFGLIAVILVAQQQYAWGLTFWLLNRVTDGLDGTLARLYRKQTDLGGYLDILFDFVVYALIPIALVIADPTQANYLALAFMLASFYINAASWMYLSAVLEKRKRGARHNEEATSVTMPNGLIGGAETIIFFTLFIVWPQQLVFLFSLMGVLVFITAAQRMVWAIQNLE